MSPTWIRSRVRHYAVLVELGYVPKVVFTKKEWQRAVPKKQWKNVAGDIQGCVYDRVVYVNRSRACCRKNSDDTAAHEVVHLKWPRKRHGASFQHHVAELMLGRVP